MNDVSAQEALALFFVRLLNKPLNKPAPVVLDVLARFAVNLNRGARFHKGTPVTSDGE